jgi:hypothetical protein
MGLTVVASVAACGVKGSIDKVTATISDAVDKLNDQSISWQGTLHGLQDNLAQDAGNLETKTVGDLNDAEKNLAHDVRRLVEQVQDVAKDGVQFTQESVNCQTDIFRAHARIALKNILNTFLNKHEYQGNKSREMLPYVPIVCSTNPNGINVGTWDPGMFLELSGTDLSLFDAKKPDIVLARSDGSELVATFGGNRVTNYRFAVNVQPLIASGFLKDAVQLQVRWSGQRVNQNEIPVVPCGGLDKPCCRGTCDAGVCADDVCQACGAPSQHCCAGRACFSGTTCVASVCTPCGAVDQPCCHGTQCNVGTCLNQQCTACGDIDQACCNGRGCNGNSMCDGGLCVPRLPNCVWTADFSEEGAAEQHCPSGFAMRGARCTGSNCDNIALWCCPYSAVPDNAAAKSWSGEFSEENGGRPYPPTASAQFLSALHCSGNYCDNIRMEFIRTPHLVFGGACFQGDWFSEEGRNYYDCPAGTWVGGLACRGNNCDDLSLYCCRGTPVR